MHCEKIIMIIFTIWLINTLTFSQLFGSTEIAIAGIVRDSETEEKIGGVKIFDSENRDLLYDETNKEEGLYCIKMKKNSYYSFIFILEPTYISSIRYGHIRKNECIKIETVFMEKPKAIEKLKMAEIYEMISECYKMLMEARELKLPGLEKAIEDKLGLIWKIKGDWIAEMQKDFDEKDDKEREDNLIDEINDKLENDTEDGESEEELTPKPGIED